MKYAAYGSNLHPIRLLDRVPSAQFLGKAVIKDKALRFHKRSKDKSGKCNIVTDTNNNVYVAVYEIHESEKPALDNAEGVGYGYRTVTLEVSGYGDCFTYVAEQSHIDDSLLPYSWYKELMLVGCEKLNFPVDYIDFVRAIPVTEDSNETRHAENMELIERARSST
jgi:gamma-glutamylcyclotransferase (GGCT)/AIG2-like uncharacterized protein YtfP